MPDTPEPPKVNRVRVHVLERWHRAWEIENPDKIVQRTFSTPVDADHVHEFRETVNQKTGRLYERCLDCDFTQLVDR